MAYIYKITNKINDKMYIGKTQLIDPHDRWKEHIREANRQRSKSSNRAIYRALNKYGIDNFKFEVIEETDNPNEREQYYIKYYNTYHNGYNETLGGDGGSYIDYPEQEICKYYLENKHLTKTAAYFGHDIKTIRNILYKHNIQIIPQTQVKDSNQQAVAQIDKNTDKIIQIFESVAAAERASGNTQHIAQVCRGTRKTTAGFKWKYVKDL